MQAARSMERVRGGAGSTGANCGGSGAAGALGITGADGSTGADGVTGAEGRQWRRRRHVAWPRIVLRTEARQQDRRPIPAAQAR